MISLSLNFVNKVVLAEIEFSKDNLVWVLQGIVLRAKLTINPDAVYRIAMRRLNTSAEVLEVMGAPLTGTDVRAYVMSGGGLRIKNFRPRLTSKRCFIIFPITGSERKGLVSIEVKKKRGQVWRSIEHSSDSSKYTLIVCQ